MQNEIEQRSAIRQWMTGFMGTRLLEVATKLDIPDRLRDAPQTAEELATTLGADALSVKRLMRCLASRDVFREDDSSRFHLTPMSELLLRDHPTSLRPAVLYFSSPYVHDAWRCLEHTVRTGEPAFENTHGVSYWGYLDTHPNEADTFNRFLAMMRPQRHAAVAKAYDFAGASTVIDVGGGYGQQLVRILHSNPETDGVLFDAPSVQVGAEDFLRAEGVGDRCRFVPGDFFCEVQAGGDVYILGDVIHDWGDDDSVRILANCRRAMSAAGRLLLVEQLASPEAAFTDLHMMVLFGEARQRSEEEFRALFERAGLRLARVLPTDSEASILEATAA